MGDRGVYRSQVNRQRFHGFYVQHMESDIWVGVDRGTPVSDADITACRGHVVKIRRLLDSYIRRHREFLTSLRPVSVPGESPRIIREMASAARAAGVGPMAAVAGGVAQALGRFVIRRLGPRELVVENGGDMFVMLSDPMNVSVYAGPSSLSGRVGLRIEGGGRSLGICTSSATVGHSFSLGRADALTVVSKDAASADAHATGLCNRIRHPSDLSPVLSGALLEGKIESVLAVMSDRVASAGRHRLQVCRLTDSDDGTDGAAAHHPVRPGRLMNHD